MTWPAVKLSPPMTCVARSTARWVASVAASLAIEASASESVACAGRLPGQQHRGIELRCGVGEQPLHRLLTAGTGPIERPGHLQRLEQCTPTHAESRPTPAECGRTP